MDFLYNMHIQVSILKLQNNWLDNIEPICDYLRKT